MPPHIEQQIKIRQLTKVQASWTEQERGEPGDFTFQLILDNGVDEYVIRPTAPDAHVLLQLLKSSSNATFDLERKVLMFGSISAS